MMRFEGTILKGLKRLRDESSRRLLAEAANKRRNRERRFKELDELARDESDEGTRMDFRESFRRVYKTEEASPDALGHQKMREWATELLQVLSTMDTLASWENGHQPLKQIRAILMSLLRTPVSSIIS